MSEVSKVAPYSKNTIIIEFFKVPAHVKGKVAVNLHLSSEF